MKREPGCIGKMGRKLPQFLVSMGALEERHFAEVNGELVITPEGFELLQQCQLRRDGEDFTKPTPWIDPSSRSPSRSQGCLKNRQEAAQSCAR